MNIEENVSDGFFFLLLEYFCIFLVFSLGYRLQLI